LLERAAPIAVADAEEPVFLRAELEPSFRSLRRGRFAVPLVTEIHHPGVADSDPELRHVVGGVRVGRRHAGQRDELRVQVARLTETARQSFTPVRRIDEPGRDAERELFGVGDAVRAYELILAEQLNQVEIGHDRVEHRQRALILEWHVHV
jgi:hypothetical protein